MRPEVRMPSALGFEYGTYLGDSLFEVGAEVLDFDEVLAAMQRELAELSARDLCVIANELLEGQVRHLGGDRFEIRTGR